MSIVPASTAPVDIEHAQSLSGLLTWRSQAGQTIHFNLGREWNKHLGVREEANTWGVGFEQLLREDLQLTLETYGHDKGESRPDKQVGLRWKAAEGLNLSIAAGRGNSRSFSQAGIVWEF